MAEEMEYEVGGVQVASANVFLPGARGEIEIVDRGVIKFKEENEIFTAPTQEAALELLHGTNVLAELDEAGVLLLLGPNSTTLFISMADGTQEKINLPADISKDAIDAIKSVPASEPDRVGKIYEVLKDKNISIEYNHDAPDFNKDPNENSIERVTTREGQVIDGDKGAPDMAHNNHELIEEGVGNSDYEYRSRRTSREESYDFGR